MIFPFYWRYNRFGTTTEKNEGRIVLLHCPTVAPPLFYMVSSFWPQSPSSVVASTSTYYQEGLSCLPEQLRPCWVKAERGRQNGLLLRSAAAFFVKLLSLELFPTLPLPQSWSWHRACLGRPAGRCFGLQSAFSSEPAALKGQMFLEHESRPVWLGNTPFCIIQRPLEEGPL